MVLIRSAPVAHSLPVTFQAVTFIFSFIVIVNWTLLQVDYDYCYYYHGSY